MPVTESRRTLSASQQELWEIIGCAFLVELCFLQGRTRLAPHDVYSLIEYMD